MFELISTGILPVLVFRLAVAFRRFVAVSASDCLRVHRRFFDDPVRSGSVKYREKTM